MNQENFQPGLDLKEPNGTEFSHDRVFGTSSPVNIPNVDWLVGSIFMHNQHNTDFCTGFGLAAVREDTEEVQLSPEWLFMQIKKLRGDPQGYGGDLKTGLKVACEIGAAEKADAVLSVDDHDRGFLLKPANWPDLAVKAKVHKGESYFIVDGPYDTFDNIRAALYANREQKRSVYTGSIWRMGWLQSPGGVLQNNPVEGPGHCYKIANGQKIIGGEPHLIVQNSGGVGVGDKGFFYMNRAIANASLKFGSYIIKDMPRETAEQLNGQQIGTKEDSWIARVLKAIANFFTHDK